MIPRRIALALACMLLAFASVPSSRAAGSPVYFGTFTQEKSEGIYMSLFDPETGTLTKAELVARTNNPVFIGFHPNRRILYAIGERETSSRKDAGTIEAFAIDPTTGRLTLLGHAEAGGGPLCYVQADRTGRVLLSASYREGYVVSFPLRGDGTPGAPASFILHSGSSVHERQKVPHAHCIDLDPASRFALVADLGLDKVYTYQLDASKGSLTRLPAPFTTKPGAGPRHLAFDRDGRHVYLVNEIDNTLSVSDYDAGKGVMKEKQLLPLLPADFRGESTASEVVLHPSGKYLYVSSRGHDSIALFAIAPHTGLLTFVAYTYEGIKHPRHFAVDPSGRWLLCGNRDANTVTLYPIDPATGRLGPLRTSIAVPTPSCVQILAQ